MMIIRVAAVVDHLAGVGGDEIGDQAAGGILRINTSGSVLQIVTLTRQHLKAGTTVEPGVNPDQVIVSAKTGLPTAVNAGDIRKVVPAQPVDATPSNQLIPRTALRTAPA